MKKILTGTALLLLLHRADAQHNILHITSGEQVYIAPGERVSLDGLVLNPSAAFTLNAGTITRNASITNPATNPGAAAQRVYHFSVLTGAFSGYFRFYYTDAEVSGINETSLAVNLFNGSRWQTVSTSSRDATQNYVETQPVSSLTFGEFTLTDQLIPLPVRWGTISGIRRAQDVALSVICHELSEINRLAIQRSENGNSWITVSEISRPSNGEQLINWTDQAAPAGVLYYRVAAVENNGMTTYSPIARVNAIHSEQKVTLRNNPVNSSFSFAEPTIAANFRRAELLQTNGAVIAAWEKYQGSFEVGNITAGTYFLRITFKDGHSATIKLVKM